MIEKILSLKNFLWIIAVSILLGVLLVDDNTQYTEAVNKASFKDCQLINASFVRNNCLEDIKYNRDKDCRRIEVVQHRLKQCLKTSSELYQKNIKISQENFSFIYIWIFLGVSLITYFTHIRDTSRY
ncbi:MAG: hypothetical protein GY909_00975 [Oligoflexia bacterium]|nr:hypothetical protein [Oligoflexia bacterium]